MGKVKRIGSNKKALAGLATALLVLILVVIGFASQETGGSPAVGQWGYGYGGGGGGGTLPGDTTAPVISEASISASAVTGTSATISWTTDEPSTSQVEYWPGSLSALDTNLVTSHSVILTDLISGTTYHYKTRSVDAAGNLTISDEHTFTTSGTAPDTTPPVLSAVSVSDVTSDSATISWTTDEPSTSQVEYGITTSSLSALDTTMVTSHSVTLTDLSSDTTYNFKVRSSDASGSLAISDEHTFTTSLAPTSWALIGGIIGAVVAAGGLAWYLWWRIRRRGNKEEPAL